MNDQFFNECTVLHFAAYNGVNSYCSASYDMPKIHDFFSEEDFLFPHYSHVFLHLITSRTPALPYYALAANWGV